MTSDCACDATRCFSQRHGRGVGGGGRGEARRRATARGTGEVRLGVQVKHIEREQGSAMYVLRGRKGMGSECDEEEGGGGGEEQHLGEYDYVCVCVPAPCVQPLLANVLPTTHFILEAAASSTSAPVWAVVMEFEQVPLFGFQGAWQERKCERAAEVLREQSAREEEEEEDIQEEEENIQLFRMLCKQCDCKGEAKACALKGAGGEEEVDAERQESLDLSKARMKLYSLGYTEEEVDAFVFAATSYRAADSEVTANELKEVALEAFLSGMRSVACKRRRLERRRRYVAEKEQDNGTQFICFTSATVQTLTQIR